MADINNLLAPAFKPLHVYAKREWFDEFWLKGGRGSTKSSFTALEIILGILRDPDANALVLRKVANTLKDSCYANFLWALEALGLEGKFKCITSPCELTYLPTGQKVIFRGLDEPAKLKGIKVKRGYFKYVWFEELAEFANMVEVENVMQSALRGGPAAMVFYSYNPPNDPQAWVNKEAKKDKPNRYVHHSTYLDVPPKWLGPKFISSAEQMRLADPVRYAHEYLGEAVGNTDAIIFSGNYTVEAFEPDTANWEGPYFGADFGFSQDPATLLEVWVDMRFVHGKKKKLYIRREAYAVGVEMDEYDQFYQKIPASKHHKIKADCSQPATISHIKGMGYDIVGAEKWPGSVEEGVRILKGFDIVVHPECPHVEEELRLYSYKVDKLTGDITTIIVDKYNHCIDALRYALDKFIKKQPMGLFDVPATP